MNALLEVAELDDRVWLLVGDVGYSVVEPFRDRYPGRFVNMGVAEQNMTGVAAGLALSGKIVFTYSIANFPTLRCLEQIRNDVCYHQADVKIVSVGGGLAYGPLGSTHHGTEDLAIMRALPGMTVVAPGDPIEAMLATRAVTATSGPCYLRLGKAGEPVVHLETPSYQLGKAIRVRDGKDVTLVTTGAMLRTAVQAAQELAEEGISTRVLSMHTLKPLDTDAVLTAAHDTHLLVTLDEHGPIGSLGEAVAHALASVGAVVPFKHISLPSTFFYEAGSQEYLRSKAGLTVNALKVAVTSALRERPLSAALK